MSARYRGDISRTASACPALAAQMSGVFPLASAASSAASGSAASAATSPSAAASAASPLGRGVVYLVSSAALSPRTSKCSKIACGSRASASTW